MLTPRYDHPIDAHTCCSYPPGQNATGRTVSEIAATCRSLRVWAHGKPAAIHSAALTVIYHLIAIARGRSSPQLYAALGENIKRMGGK